MLRGEGMGERSMDKERLINAQGIDGWRKADEYSDEMGLLLKDRNMHR
jgi:hypothetical protein